MLFDDFRFDPRVAAGVQACGFQTPTPIQLKSIPPVMEGRDVLGLAQTGTGKTAAYALPILNRLLEGPRGVLRALIMAPTRELAEQICESFHKLGKKTRLKAVTVYGGVSAGPQIAALRHGADIAVACPGRLLDHIQRRTIDLKNLEVLVLDEGDMMLDMGFLPDVRRILKHLPPQRQNLLFSATMPEAISSLAANVLKQPVKVEISHSAPVETVSHALYPVSQHLKTPLLLELLSKTDTQSVLIFTRTKHRAKRLGQQLTRQGYSAVSLQGNLSQNARQAALNGFREGRFNILVATDIAARGIDVSQVSHVINFDIPDTTDAYTHRIGRTGRALRSGDAFTLITGEDTAMVKSIEKVLGARIERRTVEGFDYKQAAPAREPEQSQAARPARAARTERSSRPERAHASHSERAGRGEESARPARPARPARHERVARPEQAERSERPARPQVHSRHEAQQPARPSRHSRSAPTANSSSSYGIYSAAILDVEQEARARRKDRRQGRGKSFSK